jgi:hypothetical protein
MARQVTKLIVNERRSTSKVPAIFVRLYPNLNFTKILIAGAELLRAGGRTEMKKLILIYRNFVKKPDTTSKETGVNGIRLLTTVFAGCLLGAQQ